MGVAERIFLVLKVQGRQQKDFAKQFEGFGIRVQTLSDWKSGKSSSYYPILPQIADALNVSLDYLYGKTDDPTPIGQNKRQTPLSDLITYSSELSPEAKKIVLEQLKLAKELDRLKTIGGETASEQLIMASMPAMATV